MGADDTLTLGSASGAEPSTTPGARTAAATPALVEGTCVGRYTVRAPLGHGGMGEVYAAHDPKLDRLVAIKVVRSQLVAPEARLRFQREAQALARLNHPNVVAIYDVGAVEDRVFVAMELVDGPTVAAWLAAGPRTEREVLAVFVQAARGLAAAHAAGITHRDFKPANVMLGDRVRVVDFGLARLVRPDDDPADDGRAMAAGTVLDAVVTRSDVAIGTPAYMAPEQRRGATANPRSDQYAFAVALHEALTGARPGAPAPEPARRLPAWLRPVIARALQPDPADRYPSMDAVLAQLARGTRDPRRRWLVAAMLVVSAGLATITWRAAAPSPCTSAEARLAGIWDATRRAAVHAAFLATGLTLAEPTWGRVSAELDRYRVAWLDMHAAACRATRVDGDQSEALMDLRMQCLDRRRAVVGELTKVWLSGIDRALVTAASDAVAQLPAIAECAEAKALLEQVPLPRDPAVVAAIAATRAELDRTRALQLAGRVAEARQRVAALSARAEATGWTQIRAEAQYLEGSVLSALRETAAEPRLLETSRLAAMSHDERLAATALVDLVNHLALDQQSAERALLVAAIADGAVARAGGDPGLRARLLRFRGNALVTAGKLAEAHALFTQARALADEAFGPGSADALESLTALAGVANTRGDNAESIRLGEQGLAAAAALFGPDHPRVAALLTELGAAAYNLSHYDAAAGYFARALAISEASAGAESAVVAVALRNLGMTETFRGRWREASALLERAQAIRERTLGPDHPLIAETLGALATVRQLQGRLDEALALTQRELAIATKVYGAADRRIAGPLQGIGDILAARGDRVEALRHEQQALAVRRQAQGDDHPRTLEAMIRVAAALRVLHRCDEARPLLSAAIAGLDKLGGDASNGLETRAECELEARQAARAAATATAAVAACAATSENNTECASKHWVLARALDAAGRPREAIAAATQAERQLSKGDAVMSPTEIAAVRAWLAARRR